ncbi:hypothetical protein VP01_2493g3 [Puccinia sorghi]|uniref:Zn(2)-C6 fungal-type domain-containing protein n=1 Tax=Puccinia sorghi TaxID=27349 RepID=A0A0L6V7M5_9BASI|nr:hypothetical protein VP01_2493g3 [Puccinia sorghi]
MKRRCKECARMNLECRPSTASQGSRMKCEACRRQKVSCRFPNGFPFGDPGNSVKVSGLSKQEINRPQRARPGVNYQIPPLLGTPEIEDLTGSDCFKPTPLHIHNPDTTAAIPRNVSRSNDP